MAGVLTRRLLSTNVLKFGNICPIISMCQNTVSSPIINTNYIFHKHQELPLKHSCISLRHFSDNPLGKIEYKPPKKGETKEKLSLFKRFKKMYKDYWYVLIPVHLVTSAAWFGGFYYLAKSGVDIAGLMESYNVSETITKPFRDSSMGYIAISYGLYKIVTPIRYTITLGGTTVSINYLKKWGYIKPVPSKEELKEMYQEKKENLLENVMGKKDNFVENAKKQQDDLIKEVNKTIEKIKKTENTSIKK
ncbi:unnamed protein product [Brassicogethes aeneus]|uniref:DUF1279 domain-containing protein n=1 Tax=Brassicogethes aeneus TaxID=1431903 RepID=A0A9P0B6T5_BRAAE|nr:unnamed protein product [Brassicogethes aeneus]